MVMVLDSAIRFMTEPSWAEAVHDRAPSATVTTKAKRARFIEILPFPTLLDATNSPTAQGTLEPCMEPAPRDLHGMPHRSNEYSRSRPRANIEHAGQSLRMRASRSYASAGRRPAATGQQVCGNAREVHSGERQ